MGYALPDSLNRDTASAGARERRKMTTSIFGDIGEDRKKEKDFNCRQIIDGTATKPLGFRETEASAFADVASRPALAADYLTIQVR
jgi:hypothetical protein